VPNGSTGGVDRPGTDGWTRLYALHSGGIRTHCARLLGDRALAEDAMHEVFIRVGRCAGRWPVPSEIRPWLFRIATNHCLNELRSRNVRARMPPQLAGPAGDPQEAMAARNDALRLLERLPPRARAVALLTYVDGMLQHEVAETLGVSRRTVVNYLTRMRASLGEASRSCSQAPNV
jgi:RNA polymerase sigma-70 factor, ECF subfamily